MLSTDPLNGGLSVKTENLLLNPGLAYHLKHIAENEHLFKQTKKRHE